MARFCYEAVCKCDKQRPDFVCPLAEVQECLCSVIIQIARWVSKILLERPPEIGNSCAVVTRRLVAVPEGEEIRETWGIHKCLSADVKTVPEEMMAKLVAIE